MSTVYLVTGANRGIGLAIVQALSQQPNAIVFAGARDPTKATDLLELANTNKNIHLLKIISNDEENNKAAAKVIEETAGKLDIVIANAGIQDSIGTVLSTSTEVFSDHFNINVLGPIVLFQAVHHLLEKSTRTNGPVFTIISTIAAQLAEQPEWPLAAYSVSKVAVNMVVKRIQLENPNLIALAIHPGSVKTDMGKRTLERLGISQEQIEDLKILVDVDTSAHGIVKVVNGAEKTASGAFLDYKGDILAY